jgi:hypothetical protein
MFRVLPFVLAMTVGIVAAAPPDLHSPTLAKQLTTALTEHGLEAIAAQDPEESDRFIAVLFFRDAQLLVVSARHQSGEALSARLAWKEYRDIYLDLSSSSQSLDSWFLQDMRADGLCSKRDQAADLLADLLYEGSTAPVVFDGDWKRRGKSESDYEQQLANADKRYSRMLEILIRQIQAG